MNFIDVGIEVSGKSGQTKVKCPKCQEDRKKHKHDTPLSVNIEHGWWKCHHCGWTGNLRGHETQQRIAERSGFENKIEPFSEHFTKYFTRDRGGITKETLQANMIFERHKFFPQLKRKALAACYPVFINKALVNVKYKSIEKVDGKRQSFQVSKEYGASPSFIGLQHLENKKLDHAIITEGEEDMLTWHECGHWGACSVPQGAPAPDSKNFQSEFDFIDGNEYARKVMDSKRTIYLCTDDDEPGRLLLEELARRLGKHKCRIVKYPDGCKDINEVMVQHGPDEVSKCLDKSEPYPVSGLIRVRDVNDEIDRIREKGFERGYLIGNEKVDRIYSLKKKALSIFTGLSGSGKSRWMQWYLVQIMKAYPGMFHACMFSPEDRPVAKTVTKMEEVYVRKRIFKHDYNSMNAQEHRKAKKFIDENFLFINPNNKEKNLVLYGEKVGSPSTLEGIVSLARLSVEQYGTNILTVDPWNKMQQSRGKNETERDFISRALDTFLEFADIYNCHVIIVAHPTKPKPIENSRNYKMPTLYDVSGSGDWKNKCDSGIIFHRDKYDDDGKKNNDAPTVIQAEKHKDDEFGEEDMINMWMDKNQGETFINELSDKMDYNYKRHQNQKEERKRENQATIPQDNDTEFTPTEEEPPF